MQTYTTPAGSFCEAQWLRVLFLISDTKQSLDELVRSSFAKLPLPDKQRLFRKTYQLSATALVHILERHYYKIPRHPLAGKFTIPVTEILHFIREAADLPATALPNSLNFQRVLTAPVCIGFDRERLSTSTLTIITDTNGRILTAFPGTVDG